MSIELRQGNFCLKLGLVQVQYFRSDLFQNFRRGGHLPLLHAPTCVFGSTVVKCPGFMDQNEGSDVGVFVRSKDRLLVFVCFIYVFLWLQKK